MHQFFFWALLVLLPTQLGLHFWPSWALVLGRRVDYLSPTLFLTDILIFLILFFWSLKGIPKISNKIIVPLSLFIIINIWFAANRMVTMYSWLKFCEFFLLGVYIVKTKPDINRVVFFLSIAILYSSVLAIIQFILQHSIGGPLWLLGERTFSLATPGIAQIPLCIGNTVSCPLFLRAYATFPHPNVLGGFMATLLPLLIIEYFNKRISNAKKYLYVISIILGIITLVLTFSRSALMVGIISLLFVLTKTKKIHPKAFVLSLIIMTGISLYVFIHNSASESIVVRSDLITASVNIWKQHPLLGVGLGNFLTTLPRFLPSREIYFLQPVHNIYLLLLSEIGMVGFVVIGWFIAIGIKKPRGIYFLLFITYCTLGLIDHYPFTLQQGRLLFTLLLAFLFIR